MSVEAQGWMALPSLPSLQQHHLCQERRLLSALLLRLVMRAQVALGIKQTLAQLLQAAVLAHPACIYSCILTGWL